MVVVIQEWIHGGGFAIVVSNSIKVIKDLIEMVVSNGGFAIVVSNGIKVIKDLNEIVVPNCGGVHYGGLTWWFQNGQVETIQY